MSFPRPRSLAFGLFGWLAFACGGRTQEPSAIRGAGVFDGSVTALALTPDGDVVVAGTYSSHDAPRAARFGSQANPLWDLSGSTDGGLCPPTGLAVTTDGNVYLAGICNGAALRLGNDDHCDLTLQFNDAYLAALEPGGACRWSRGLSNNSRSATLGADDETLVVVYRDRLVGLDSTGAQLWERPLITQVASSSSPRFVAKIQDRFVLLSVGGASVGIVEADGAIKPVGESVAIQSATLLPSGSIVVSSDTGLHAYDVDGNASWSDSGITGQLSGDDRGNVYVATHDGADGAGHIVSLDIDGKRRWTWPTGATVESPLCGSLVAARGVDDLYVTSSSCPAARALFGVGGDGSSIVARIELGSSM